MATQNVAALTTMARPCRCACDIHPRVSVMRSARAPHDRPDAAGRGAARHDEGQHVDAVRSADADAHGEPSADGGSDDVGERPPRRRHPARRDEVLVRDDLRRDRVERRALQRVRDREEPGDEEEQPDLAVGAQEAGVELQSRVRRGTLDRDGIGAGARPVRWLLLRRLAQR